MAAVLLTALRNLSNLELESTQKLCKQAAAHQTAVKLLIQNARQQLVKAPANQVMHKACTARRNASGDIMLNTMICRSLMFMRGLPSALLFSTVAPLRHQEITLLTMQK